MPMEIEFRPGRVDADEGAALAQGMRDELFEIYDGLRLDGPDMPKAGPEELSPPDGSFLVGWSGGAAVCCGGLKRLPDGACEIKKMFVAPSARGQGVARTLLHALEDEARRLGYAVARLDTGPKQPHAQRLYESEGYREIGNFNDNPVATYFAEKQL
ncbi:GNAT family N-acetyltransferase [Paraconexibacter algicola]|uniref:GNAT family N-acetyltransferase n=1 Tax=Paraconexibacter algicola TaxID=2133960 RepID=A0A2T4UD33_9ACTN|nr:GNAT family N-acetyltransferase [Paraconexibacter algicola]PTL55403.1 GNAT family N-acetyltransferase [Paraconexibacter algicola]